MSQSFYVIWTFGEGALICGGLLGSTFPVPHRTGCACFSQKNMNLQICSMYNGIPLYYVCTYIRCTYIRVNFSIFWPARSCPVDPIWVLAVQDEGCRQTAL
ncbi:hypothetical protein GGR54DRAFT_618546 [Hypoxylon sp. NC1633]|nr:hypothetical protein GGR54DRAFT_618546 [Hypoxylon sp. NC1633]